MAAIDGWDALAYALLAQRLASGGCVQLTIAAASMAPFLLPGDRVLIARVPVASLGVGDLVALAAPPCPIVHRIMAAPGGQGKQPLVTKGDAGITFDRQSPSQAVLGRVISVQRSDKTLTLATHIAHWGSRILAWLSCLCANAVNLSSPFLRRGMFFLLRRTMYVVSGVVWSTGQGPSAC